jgi:hypothetical protein
MDSPIITPPESRGLVKGRSFTNIGKVGIELEGGWIETPAFKLHSDGSVSCEGKKGEAHTEPTGNYDELFKDLRVKYPDIVDASCGMHIHCSMDDLHYAYLSNPKFWDYFKCRMELLDNYLEKGPSQVDHERFHSRLQGRNDYCKKMFVPDKQIWKSNKGGDRYAMLNFCYTLHGTMECRLFPMFTEIRNAKVAIVEYIDTIETFISNHKETQTYRMTVEIPDDSNSVKEELCV